MEIREARPADFAAAGDVAVAAYAGFYGDELGSYEGALRDVEGRARDGVVLLAIVHDAIAGTVTYVADDRSPLATGRQRAGEASIRMLSVEPAYGRRGIGRALSIACIERARSDGKSSIVLHADEEMRASQALYESLGFRRDPSRDFHPDDVTALVCYVLKL